VAAALIALIIVGALLVSNFNRRPTGVVPGAQPSPSPYTTVSPVSTPPDSSLPAFTCVSSTQLVTTPTSSQPPVIFVDGVRAGTHTGYDRITIQFQNGSPSKVDLSLKATPTSPRSKRPTGHPPGKRRDPGDDHTATSTRPTAGPPTSRRTTRCWSRRDRYRTSRARSSGPRSVESACYRAFFIATGSTGDRCSEG